MNSSMTGTVNLRALICFGLFAAAGYFACPKVAHRDHFPAADAGRVSDNRQPGRLVSKAVEPVAPGLEAWSLDQLRIAVADAKAWQGNPNRTEAIQTAFRQHARNKSAVQAIRDACEVFSIPARPSLLKEAGIEIAAISCLEAGGATEAELATLLSSGGEANRPLLRAFAFFSDPRDMGGAYSRLKRILDLSEARADAVLQRVIVAAAIQAAADCKPGDLASLASLAQGIKGDELISLIAAGASAFDRDLALQFVVEQSAGDAGRLAKFVRGLRLPPEALAAFCGKLSATDVAIFAPGYARQLERGNPLLYTELAKAIGPEKLPENARSLFIGGLLKNGGGYALDWLESLPVNERASALSQAYDSMIKQPGWANEFSKAWLEAASKCQGMDDKQMAAALRNASSSLEWDTALSYARLLSPEVRTGVERDLYFWRASKLAGGDRDVMLAFVESAPAALKPAMLANAAHTVALFSPDDALSWYRETSDPAAKKALEDGMMASPNLTKVPIETRKTWIMERLKDDNYLQRGSLAVNSYIRDLSATDAPAALGFAKALPDSNLRDEAFRVMAREWSARDPQSSSKWIVELPAGRGRDFALTELTKASRDEPESAFVNVTAISDPKLRMQAATSVVEWWKARDPGKIGALINQSALTEEDKKILLQVLGK